MKPYTSAALERGRWRWGLSLGSPVQGLDDLAIHVEPQLVRRPIADPYRGRALVAGQPGQLPFPQVTLSGDHVHELQVFRITGHGAQEPSAPCPRLLPVPGPQERGQRRGGVPKPSEAIVRVTSSCHHTRCCFLNRLEAVIKEESVARSD